MYVAEDALVKIKVDERKDALQRFLDEISQNIPAHEGKDGLDEHLKRFLAVPCKLHESLANIAQIKETISETPFTIAKSSRDRVSAPDNTVAVVVDVRKRGSCRVFNARRFHGGADANITKNVVVMPWHNTWKYLCVEEVEMAYILAARFISKIP
ncbi:hypothetical protein T440DRAFT_316358 [Plenodomus tracheiphilus IPT5]|uniref:Uncharacterized protein n=1 Tax=Plenodomus tracheiphilus IPT5 TaxID=1408161 RepID=A0A6A7AQS7_9PLEO|nr:hypothetical protein T440DRAFT_316358 [Plenodomus tracheiphilus IPT5]